ncbi:MAG: hypothetical protein R3B36_00225 [Polyangiaceae bacterium]
MRSLGIEILKETFDDAERDAFAAKLQRCLEAMRELLARPGFGEGPPSVGAEVELDLVDAAGRPAPVNRAVLAATNDPRVTLEVDRFNLEINASPAPLAGRPFTFMAGDLSAALAATRKAAHEHGARVATIGILPTFREDDLRSDALTDGVRYRALSRSILQVRGQPFPVRIQGEDALDVVAPDVTFEGANTSLQVHLRVTPDAFARTYNAAQLATAVVLAVSGNSPFFLGKRLWDETRIALFRQTVDDRAGALDDDWRPARVSFGHGWVRRGALELFEEAVALHAPLLPVCDAQDPIAELRAGRAPELRELRLHQGTVWRWNRAIYDHDGGGHLRIELRAFPSGPTVRDMTANAAFAVGLTLALADEAERLVTQMTFGQARRNFYEAARRGLDAELLWPSAGPPSPRVQDAATLAVALLPRARAGLVDHGVEASEADAWLEVIRARVEARTTGARWLRDARAELGEDAWAGRGAADALARYVALSESDEPVHTWPRL